MNTKRILAPVAAIGLVFGLAACSEEAAEPVAEANPDCVPGIEVTGGWLALAAIDGDPSAVYFTIENTGTDNQMIRGADVLGYGSAMLHSMGEWNMQPSMDELLQVDVPAGGVVVFEPETMHVMAMEPDGTQAIGGDTEVTLTFVRGDKCSFPVAIRAPGDAPPATEE